MRRALDLLTDLQSGDCDPWQTVQQHFHAMGINGIVCAQVNRGTGDVTGALIDAADDWHERYHLEGYHTVDPWVKLVRNSIQPFRYSFEERHHLLPSLHPLAERLCREACETEHRSSILFPGNVSASTNVGINLWTNEPAKPFQLWIAEQERALGLMASVAMTYLNDCMNSQTTTPSAQMWQPSQPFANPLTLREREALLWLAKGYRTDRIADRMNITNATVTFHLQSARRRLGAATREQTIALAVSQGLIAV